jgi:hypothetical protein
MHGFIGEVEVTDRFADRTPAEWAMIFIERYGQIDGEHHKAWVLDQVVRILKGTKVIVKEAYWKDGQKETRFRTAAPSVRYLNWVTEMKDGGEYDYNEGIAH